MGKYVWGNRRGMYDQEINGAKKSKEMSNKNKIWSLPLFCSFFKKITQKGIFTKMFKLVPCK